MNASLKFDDAEFQRALRQVSQASHRSDYEIVTMNGRTLLKALVWNTPMAKGYTRAGWWSAWSGMGMGGTPGTRQTAGTHIRTTRKGKLRYTYNADGAFVDDRNNREDRAVEFKNRTHMIRPDGRRVDYPWILNRKVDWLGAGYREATFKFGKIYDAILKKHSAGRG